MPGNGSQACALPVFANAETKRQKEKHLYMKRIVSILGLLALLSVAVPAVETATWSQSSAEDFEKGRRERIALHSDGTMRLAPAVTELLDASSNAIWALAADSKGVLYAAAPAPEGGKVRVFRVPAQGKAETITDIDGLTAFAIAVDRQQQVYVAVSPQSQVYRIRDGKAELFYEPPAEYVWQMAFEKDGSLLVATGDKGVIYRVNAAGEGSVFFETEETHVRTMLLDDEGNVYAGTSPGGLVMRISPAGEGFVVHQSDRTEIAALARDSEGNVYAAALGAKRSPGLPRMQPTPITPPSSAQPGQAGQTQQPRPTAPTATAPPPIRAALTGGSQLLRIDSEGFPSVIWESDSEYIYSLAVSKEGKLLAGTGNNGNVHEVKSAGKSTALLKTPADQVTALLPLDSGGFAFATSNIGKVFRAGPELAEDGYFESDVFDSEFFARWGRLSAYGGTAGGAVTISARSGNVNHPGKNWSDWVPAAEFGEEQSVAVPPARYYQWRAEFRRGNGDSPELREVRVAYRNRNVPPIIVATEATPPNYGYPPRNLSINPTEKITLTPLSGKARLASSALSTTPLAAQMSMNYTKGHVGVRWLAEDANNDELRYSLEIRPTGGGNWMTLAEKLDEPQYSWDSTSWPDGRYEVRIAVSDHKSNPPGEALTASAVTSAFLIDNTKPVIENLSTEAVSSGSALVARWAASDALSHVRRAEYSLNGKDWVRIEPVNGLSDARSLRYELRLNPAPSAGTVITVRVRDEFDNEAVSSLTVGN
jgi:hypothetical protein